MVMKHARRVRPGLPRSADDHRRTPLPSLYVRPGGGIVADLQGAVVDASASQDGLDPACGQRPLAPPDNCPASGSASARLSPAHLSPGSSQWEPVPSRSAWAQSTGCVTA